MSVISGNARQNESKAKRKQGKTKARQNESKAKLK
jgi:hypothetical protein